MNTATQLGEHPDTEYLTWVFEKHKEQDIVAAVEISHKCSVAFCELRQAEQRALTNADRAKIYRRIRPAVVTPVIESLRAQMHVCCNSKTY